MVQRPANESQLSPETLNLLRVFADAIKTARKQRRLRQDDLAQRAGTSRATIQRMERGDPGIGLGLFLEALVVLDRDFLTRLTSTLTNDPAGVLLMTSQLPKRVRVIGYDDDF